MSGQIDMRVVNLRKSFGRRSVLSGLTLGFPKGKITVVLGSSGCGKSVMLKHLVGLLRPDRGEVWFGSTRVDTLPERELGIVRRQIGFLFQQSALFDSLTVRENIAFPLREHGMTEQRLIDDKVERVLGLVGLTETAEQMPSELSGGQRKRIALARAVVLEPRVVLYDEPTTGLDPIRAEVINELILKFSDTLGITSIVVTHDLVSAFRIADHMVLLNDGKVLIEGTPADLRDSKIPYAMQFLKGEISPEELARIRSSGDHGSIGTT
ncbi:MAG: ATP-binding cassette domain-containing protein [Phycisphaerales bacterium]|nr:ATP-binding cassette domain-containing protein [Phycisphaerales bacterium]